jgi:hypothetical protein
LIELTYIKSIFIKNAYQCPIGGRHDFLSAKSMEVNMTTLVQENNYPRHAKRNMKPCETPGCAGSCTYAYSCHEERMGRTPAVFWPGVGLAIMAALAIFV